MLLLWSMIALKYVSLPPSVVQSAEQCLAHWSLTRDALPLTNKDTRAMLIKNNQFKAWNRGKNITGQCCQMIAGDSYTLMRLKHAEPPSERSFYIQFNSCASLQAELYNTYYVSKEEKQFPLAYVVLVHNNPVSLMRFLKAVYRRHNAYCIHYDQKSSDIFKSFIHLLSSCTDNVILPKKIENVVWGDASILNAQLNCLGDLLNYHSTVPWRYAFNLQGHELPLRTNREMVEMLQSQPANTSIVESWSIKDYIDKARFTYRVQRISLPWAKEPLVGFSSEKLAPFAALNGIEIYKSWCFIAATPRFVHYTLESELSKKLFNFLQDVASAEEYFFATLYNDKNTPGGRYESLLSSKATTAHVVDYYSPPFAVSVCVWLLGVYDRSKYCGGTSEHQYCHFSVKDLKSIFGLFVNGELVNPFPVNNYGHGLSPVFVGGTKKSLFVNKYMTDTDPTIMNCLEQRLALQNMLEYYHDHDV